MDPLLFDKELKKDRLSLEVEKHKFISSILKGELSKEIEEATSYVPKKKSRIKTFFTKIRKAVWND